MTPSLRLEVLHRSGGSCECGCGVDLARGVEIDHFFGRAKSNESASTVWALTPRCHFKKTTNHPTAAEWLTRFIAHCGRHGYASEGYRAQSRLFWREVIARSNQRSGAL